MIDRLTIQEAARVIRNGGVVILPTDTVYGIGADPDNAAAVRKLFAVKGRDDGKPIALLATDASAVQRWGCTMTVWEQALAQRYWPGPLTIVLETAAGAEGFRVPACDTARAVLHEAGGVLRVTSANRSGDAPALTLPEALNALDGRVDYAVDAGPVTGGVPSTVVRLQGAAIQILRQGALQQDELEECVARAVRRSDPHA